MSLSVTIDRAATRSGLNAFIRLPYRLHRDRPHWTPPLLCDEKARVIARRHPFFEDGRAEFYVARRGDRPVGRIAAIDHPRHNEYHGERTGFFGFFECENDPEAAGALFAAAGEWLAAAGLETMRGPASFTMNEECGILVEGFDEPPVVAMPYNPPYYADLAEGAGFAKAKDLLAYCVDRPFGPVLKYERAAAAAAERFGMNVRPADMDDLDRDLEAAHRLYNETWSDNWGFVPATETELNWFVERMRPLVRPNYFSFIDVEGQPVAFGLAVLDGAPLLRAMKGRILPLGWLRFLVGRGRLKGLRVILLGVASEWRRRGALAMIAYELMKRALAEGFEYGEFSWILEDNRPMRTVIENLGARLSKRYRMYEKVIG